MVNESEIKAVLSKTNLPSINTNASFGGISPSLTILLFLTLPIVLVATLVLLCEKVTVGKVLTPTFET